MRTSQTLVWKLYKRYNKTIKRRPHLYAILVRVWSRAVRKEIKREGREPSPESTSTLPYESDTLELPESDEYDPTYQDLAGVAVPESPERNDD